MSELKIFKNEEFGEVRTMLVNGEPYFVGKDVASVLGYSNTRNAILQHVDSEDDLKQGVPDSQGFTQQTTLINESGLYSLIFGSKLESAKSFKRWVTSEVLPAIRKTGKLQFTVLSNRESNQACRNMDSRRKRKTGSKRTDKATHRRKQKLGEPNRRRFA